MKKVSVLLVAFAMVLVFATAAWGISLGARAAGMGGAFTAVADDCSAVYWNPAGITQLKVLTLTPGLGFQGDPEELNQLIDSLTNQSFPPNIPTGVEVGFSGNLGITTRYFGLNGIADGNIVTKDESGVDKFFGQANGFGVGTIALPFGPLAIGGSIKYVYNNYYEMSVQQDTSSGFSIPDNYFIQAQGQGLSFDAGVLFSLTNHLKIGFAARNFYSNVDWSGSKTNYSLDASLNIIEYSIVPFSISGPLPSTYSLGVALRPTNSTLIAADVETITNPINSQFEDILYHIGLEQKAFWKTTSLRLGMFTTSADTIGYSAGLGFKLGPVLIDGALTEIGQTSGFYATAGFKF